METTHANHILLRKGTDIQLTNLINSCILQDNDHKPVVSNTREHSSTRTRSYDESHSVQQINGSNHVFVIQNEKHDNREEGSITKIDKQRLDNATTLNNSENAVSSANTHFQLQDRRNDMDDIDRAAALITEHCDLEISFMRYVSSIFEKI